MLEHRFPFILFIFGAWTQMSIYHLASDSFDKSPQIRCHLNPCSAIVKTFTRIHKLRLSIDTIGYMSQRSQFHTRSVFYLLRNHQHHHHHRWHWKISTICRLCCGSPVCYINWFKMLKLAVFNSIKYSFNKKTGVSNRARLRHSQHWESLQGVLGLCSLGERNIQAK